MKKKYPLEILRQLNTYKKNVPSESKLVKPEKGYIRYEDVDSESDFYFQINSYAQDQNGFYYNVKFKPTSANNLEKREGTYKYADLNQQIKNWSNVLKQFNETEYFDNDPITTNYTKEFFQEYKIIEDGADEKPFDLKRQILIDKYLDSSIKYLEKYEEENPEIDLTETKEEANNLKEHLTELSKNQVVKKLSKFWALCRKDGLPIIKKVFFDLAKELITELGKKMIGM
ncbi:hypothetical protein P700755_003521 [Psychroflexus torquis ATCC 700755]|uniref:Uncharacterized protein n=1 Tax=Psychroflexus torquis (strain ATCC 700755 / CIP 106069 / ACAM 623) TaxID=313595 RepID=K4IHX5_PSYTT|nr:hypothetical protein [Psychroflexus torquis]AFU70137.1 hypothetical protein P700755_003521 [Psychroflexus torquis ATCC 700755]